MSEENMLNELKEQEEMLQFSEFTNQMALQIGIRLVEKATEQKKPITVSIKKNGRQVFQYASEETTPIHDQWIIRKSKVAEYFHSSSLYIGKQLKAEGKTMEEKYLLPSEEYAAYGGSFPIIIKNVGVIGSITASGSRQLFEHNLIVEVLKEILHK